LVVRYPGLHPELFCFRPFGASENSNGIYIRSAKYRMDSRLREKATGNYLYSFIASANAGRAASMISSSVQ
jgi:hypothetical protein